MTGILLVDKPEGWTSFDVIAKLRGITHVRRIGHSGTLDPMATGLLPVFISREYTRLISTYEGADKEYVAGLRLGVVTDTYDTTGNTLLDAPAAVTRADLERALEPFRGEQLQTPPMYSAVKIGGERLYKIARRGDEVERPARPITVYDAEILGGADADWLLRFVVSKGTYIRSLCHDVGQKLGVGGAMSSLRRTRVGEFTIENSLTLEEIAALAASGELEKRFIK
ncbi:MAG: tRNA pseudouridine(55) synthase TruB [Oscillospiraceae bacterium]|nr:tRNA pseudouridine(55) synthase TruB [Oscillospiraceae bacterium]